MLLPDNEGSNHTAFTCRLVSLVSRLAFTLLFYSSFNVYASKYYFQPKPCLVMEEWSGSVVKCQTLNKRLGFESYYMYCHI